MKPGSLGPTGRASSSSPLGRLRRTTPMGVSHTAPASPAEEHPAGLEGGSVPLLGFGESGASALLTNVAGCCCQPLHAAESCGQRGE